MNTPIRRYLASEFLEEIKREIERREEAHGPLRSPLEGLTLLNEDHNQLEYAVYSEARYQGTPDQIRTEAILVAAGALQIAVAASPQIGSAIPSVHRNGDEPYKS